MKTISAGLLLLAFILSASTATAQATTAKPAEKIAKAPSTPQDLNIQEYIELLRNDLRSQKAEVMGAVLQLDISQSAKFWPIYEEYDAELNKINDLRIANITQYSKNYSNMSDQEADALIHNAIDYQTKRNALLAQYYEKVKAALGATTAARFALVEHQLLLIIDLQITSQLPIAGS